MDALSRSQLGEQGAQSSVDAAAAAAVSAQDSNGEVPLVICDSAPPQGHMSKQDQHAWPVKPLFFS